MGYRPQASKWVTAVWLSCSYLCLKRALERKWNPCHHQDYAVSNFGNALVDFAEQIAEPASRLRCRNNSAPNLVGDENNRAWCGFQRSAQRVDAGVQGCHIFSMNLEQLTCEQRETVNQK